MEKTIRCGEYLLEKAYKKSNEECKRFAHIFLCEKDAKRHVLY